MGVNFDEDDEEEIKPVVRKIVEKKEPEKKVERKKRSTPGKILTQKDVLDYIEQESGKWGGFATLKAVITRHKAISTSVLSAIVDIHRKFKEWM